MSKVIVKHIPQTRSPYGREQRPVRTYNPQSGLMEEVGSKSGKRKPNKVFETLKFDPDRAQGKFKTGLDAFTSNPFVKMDTLEIRGKYGLSDKWTDKMIEKITSDEKISFQQYYEILDGTDPGYYTSTMANSLKNSPLPIRTDFTKGDETFIEKFEIILYEGSNTFNTGTSRGRLAIKLLQNSSLVAKTKGYINKDVHHWYIAEEFEEEKTRTEIDDLENDAIVALTDLLKKQPTQRAYQVGVAMDLFSGHLNEVAIKDQLNRFVKAKVPQHLREKKLQRLSKFMTTYDMLTSNYPMFISTYMANQAMRTGILYNDNGKVYWRSRAETPETFTWKNKKTLVLALMESMNQYDPKKEFNDNIFGDMVEELRDRGITVDVN